MRPTAQIHKGYRVLNLTIVGFIAYMLSLPFLAGTALAESPYWQCAYKQHTGRPCPYCGLTRDLDALFHGKWGDTLNPFAGILGLIVFTEFLWRVWLLTPWGRNRLNVRTARRDLAVHLLVFAGLVAHLLNWALGEVRASGL